MADSGKCQSLFSNPRSLSTWFEAQSKLTKSAIDFFNKNLRIPSTKELSSVMSGELTPEMIKIYDSSSSDFWQHVFSSHPQKINDSKEWLIKAYYDAVVAIKKTGVTPRSLTEQELFSQLLINHPHLKEAAGRGDFEVKHVQRLLGVRQRKSGLPQYPVLFDGLEGLRLATKQEYPHTFRGFRDQKYSYEYHEKTVELIASKYRGVLATSLTGGMPFNSGQFNALIKLAEAKNLLILVKEVNAETDLIPPEVVAHPRVRIITHTIDLGPELRLWGGMMIIPTNKNPLAGLLDRSMARTRGQTQIVFSPQRAMSPVATEKNDIHGTHQVWSTGSLSEPTYSYSNARSSRVTTMAAERHINSAVLIEKSSAEAGPLGRGAPGRWHIRNVDFERSIDDPQYGSWPAGITDAFTFYPADGSSPRPNRVVAAIPGDIHHGFADQRYTRAMLQQIFAASRAAGAPIEYIRLHDFNDFGTISPWDRSIDRSSKFKKGELDLQAEINQSRAFINDLLSFEPNLKIILSSVDNHNYWLVRQLDNPLALADPVNGPLLIHLRSMRDKGYDVFEYIYKQQEAFDRAIPDIVAKSNAINKNVYVQKTENLIVLKSGQRFDVTGRGWNLSSHGHQIDRGKKAGASLEPHARGNDRVVIGHTHEAGILSYAFNPGMSVRLRSQEYALNGYSTQQNALMLIYANGSGQLLLFDPVIGEFLPSGKPLPGGSFFTERPFVVEDANDVVQGDVKTLNNYDGGKPAR